VLPQQLGAPFRVPAFLVSVGVEHGNQIVELAAAQGIMHEMGARAGPQDHVGPPQVLGYVFALEHGAIGDVAGDARASVSADTVADLRPHAVAADERTALRAFAVVKDGGDGVAMVLVRVDTAAVLQRD
jgi:hypothetical protein